MGFIEIVPSGRHFVSDGKPFLFAADTAWSAPTNAPQDEWRAYLRLRSSQGFTTILMNLLPQWDRSRSDGDSAFGLAEAPFAAGSDGGFDYSRPNEAYFARVDSLVADIRSHGLLPALVILWADYAPKNWCSVRNPGRVVPDDRRDGLAAFLASRYAPYEPVYLVAGDTDLNSPEVVEFYRAALAACKKAAPRCLTCLHLCGGYTALPPAIEESPHLDFYMYQSGHKPNQDHLERMAAAYRRLKPRPIVNGEICYEGLGRHGSLERFGPWDVRRAIWLSALSGAAAGFGYGAFGVWNWHRGGNDAAAKNFGSSPTVWQALAFPEAARTGLTVEMWRLLGLGDAEPIERPAPKDGPGIFSETETGIAFARLGGGRGWALYSDSPRAIRLPPEIRAAPIRCWDFEAGTLSRPILDAAGGETLLDLGGCRQDALVWFER